MNIRQNDRVIGKLTIQVNSEVEPKIEDENENEAPEQYVKKTSLKYKIEPPLASFPTSENVSKERLVEIKQKFNQF